MNIKPTNHYNAINFRFINYYKTSQSCDKFNYILPHTTLGGGSLNLWMAFTSHVFDATEAASGNHKNRTTFIHRPNQQKYYFHEGILVDPQYQDSEGCVFY